MCVPHTSVADCIAAAESVCTACAFSRRPTPSNTAHEAHAVWFDVFFIVVVGLIVLVATIVVIRVVVLVNRVMHKVRVANQRETTCIFEMSRSNVTSQPERHGSGAVLNRQVVVFDDGAVPVGVVSKELLCREPRKNPNVQLVAKGADDVSSVLQNRPS